MTSIGTPQLRVLRLLALRQPTQAPMHPRRAPPAAQRALSHLALARSFPSRLEIAKFVDTTESCPGYSSHPSIKVVLTCGPGSGPAVAVANQPLPFGAVSTV